MPFQKLLIWQKGMDLVDLIYEATRKFPKDELYGLTSQVRRSAVSIPSNIAEGSQRSTQKEFGKFVLIAKGSLAELHTQILISHRQKYLADNNLEKISGLIIELDKMIRSFHLKLQKNY